MNDNWILCSERLPVLMKHEQYKWLFLVTIEIKGTEGRFVAPVRYVDGEWKFNGRTPFGSDVTAIAWQPFPPPYRGE